MPKATLQQLLQGNHRAIENQTNGHVRKTLLRLQSCRTGALGYHVYRCSDEHCGKIKYQYHSCRNRHCPQCGGLKKQDWIDARMQELLPVPYYHVVFTIPHELNSIIMGNQKAMYRLLFNAASQTLLRFAADEKWMGAVPGIIAVLHTWGQQLSYHPHLHCIVSGGGICKQTNTWKPAVKNEQGILFAVKALSRVYKAKYLQGLKKLLIEQAVMPPPGADMTRLINDMYAKDWVVYAKAPFAGPHAVVEYLGRYTHKVAISNHRISSIDAENKTISFNYKDYADGNAGKQMQLTAAEFIRRFAQHILPKQFCKIRSYGYLANRNRHQRINEILQQMDLKQHKGLVKTPVAVKMMEQYGVEINKCPCCGKPTLELMKIYFPWKPAADG
jgi:hypothetical protein